MNRLIKRYLIVLSLFISFFFITHISYGFAKNNLIQCPISENGINVIKQGRIESIAVDQSSLQVQCSSSKTSEVISISVKKPELITTLQGFSSGDFVNLSYTADHELNRLSVVKLEVNGFFSLVILITTGIGLYFITFLIVLFVSKEGSTLSLNNIFVGQDKRLSNSKSQMAVWFFVVLVSYISLSILRAINGGLEFVGGIGIPQNLLFLSGLSALTYGGAKVITQSQVNSNPASKQDAPEKKAGLQDFFTDDEGKTDFGDLQMTFITLLAVVVYLIQLLSFLSVLELHRLVSLPDLDTTILSIFGLSQGAYLTKKAVVATGAK